MLETQKYTLYKVIQTTKAYLDFIFSLSVM